MKYIDNIYILLQGTKALSFSIENTIKHTQNITNDPSFYYTLSSGLINVNTLYHTHIIVGLSSFFGDFLLHGFIIIGMTILLSAESFLFK